MSMDSLLIVTEKHEGGVATGLNVHHNVSHRRPVVNPLSSKHDVAGRYLSVAHSVVQFLAGRVVGVIAIVILTSSSPS